MRNNAAYLAACEASNLWGAFDRVRRNLQRVRLHFACKAFPSTQ